MENQEMINQVNSDLRAINRIYVLLGELETPGTDTDNLEIELDNLKHYLNNVKAGL